VIQHIDLAVVILGVGDRVVAVRHNIHRGTGGDRLLRGGLPPVIGGAAAGCRRFKSPFATIGRSGRMRQRLRAPRLPREAVIDIYTSPERASVVAQRHGTTLFVVMAIRCRTGTTVGSPAGSLGAADRANIFRPKFEI
jgi:hypothetical protein